MILQCLVIPQDADTGLLVEPAMGYHVFFRRRLGSLGTGPTIRMTIHESTYGYVVFETMEHAEQFAMNNKNKIDVISREEWYVLGTHALFTC